MDQKNRQIINVAIEKFSAKGFTQTTMQEIAREAGVGKGTIYRFFRSKEDLVYGLIESAITEITDRIRSEVGKLADPVDKLRAVIRVELEYYAENRDLSKFLAREVWGYQNKFADHIRHIRATQGQILEEIIEEGMASGQLERVEPETAAAGLEGMVLATAVHWFMFREDFPGETIRHTVERIALRGMLVS